MKTIKKLLSGLLFLFLILSNVSCNSRSKIMSNLEGKNGLFAIIETNRGSIAVELFYKQTPLTVTNFVGLAEGTLDAAKGKPYYNGLKFHRVISIANGDSQNFMIQGGDPLGNGSGGPGYKFVDEIVPEAKFDVPGKLAMANAGENTNGSQFFITIVPTEWLNGKHTIFGEVVYGQEIVNKTKQNDTIKSIEILRQGEEASKFTATQSDFNKLSKEAKEKNEKAKQEAFDNLVKGYTKASNGVYYKVTEEGKGSAIGKGKTVKVDYKGYLPTGQIFDASEGFHPQGHEPLEFEVGSGMMIPGFDSMVQEMKIGETRKMVIPPELAYGDWGMPQAGIPAKSYICFDVKLLSAN